MPYRYALVNGMESNFFKVVFHIFLIFFRIIMGSGIGTFQIAIKVGILSLNHGLKLLYISYMSSTDKLWLQLAEYDLKTAKAMLQTGRHLYVASCVIKL